MFTSADLLPPPPPPPPSAESPPSSTDYHLDNDGYQDSFFLLESVSDDYGDESSSSSSGSSSSSSSAPNNNKYGGDHFYNEETPLVGHVSYRKTEPPPSNASSKKNDIFRSAGSGSGRGSKQDQKFSLRTIYSAISDTMSATGCTNQTDDSWTEDGDGRDDSDNVKIIINTKSDYNDDDDEDRSIYSLANESVRSLTTLTTVQLDNFKEGLKIPFTDETGSVSHIINGLSSLFVIGTTLGIIMPKDDDLSTTIYKFISSVIGYNYFVLWSICFYPQVLLNYRRKSTHGLSNDFAILNFMGWTFYSSYVCSMFYSTTIQDMYEERFGTGAAITVQSNDVAFAIHAATLSFIYIVQIVWYSGRWSESKSKFPLKPQTWILVFSMGIPSVTIPICIHLGILDTTRWLDYFYLLSFFKICCTLTKYTKQVMHNYHRKSTKGWNIWYSTFL